MNKTWIFWLAERGMTHCTCTHELKVGSRALKLSAVAVCHNCTSINTVLFHFLAVNEMMQTPGISSEINLRITFILASMLPFFVWNIFMDMIFHGLLSSFIYLFPNEGHLFWQMLVLGLQPKLVWFSECSHKTMALDFAV